MKRFYNTAEIYCYCNTEACGGASSGYKCRSQSGRCFSKMRYDPQPNDVDNSIHGCADSLANDEKASCEPGDIFTRRTNAANSLNDLPILMCCTANMCNYIDQVDPPNVALDVFTENFTQKDSRHGQYGNNLSPRQPTLGKGEYYSHQDTWFRAAVVAVPLVGAIILVVLILMALRMLRHDNRRQMKRDASLAKAQLYVADHFYVQATSPIASPGSIFPQSSPCKGNVFTGKLSPTASHGIICNSDMDDNNSCMQTGYTEREIDINEQRMSGTYIMRARPIHYCCSPNCNYPLAESKSLILYTTENETCLAQNHDRKRQTICCQKNTDCICNEGSECSFGANKVFKKDTVDGIGQEDNNQSNIHHERNHDKEKGDNFEINQNNEQTTCIDSISISIPNDKSCDTGISLSDQKDVSHDENDKSQSNESNVSHDQGITESGVGICENLENVPSCYEPLLSDSERS